VPATSEGWSVDPFAGIERDGAIWGRGTVDMKGQVAASAVALATLAREGFEPAGDLMLLLMADEEVGTAGVGASFFVEQRPDLGLDYVVGEGAGERFETPAGPLYLLACGSKATVEVVMKVSGRPADISLPDAGPNALYEVARLLGRLQGHRFPSRVIPAVAPLIDVLSPGPEAVEARLERARCAAGPALGRIVTALTSTVIHPSVLAADGPKNVAAEEATVTFSASTLPGVEAQDLEAELRSALGEGAYELEVVPPKGGLVSEADTALMAAINSFLSEHDRGARLVPALGYGYSDCDVMREAYGSIAYGFIPFRHASARINLDTKHGIDEHVLIDDLAFQTEAALWIARTVSGSDAR
jgi:acetylornithine deacetylase/succinyl-diaminopimelate desuccinylase-like protein